MKLSCFIGLTVTFLINGCATFPPYKAYTDEATAKSELAYLKCDSQHNHDLLGGLDQRLYISKIDNEGTFSFFYSIISNQMFPESAYVLPGRHYISINYRNLNWYANGQLWLDAEKGETYIVRKAMKNYEIRFWIENERTGKLVGGIPGGEPENNTTKKNQIEIPSHKSL